MAQNSPGSQAGGTTAAGDTAAAAAARSGQVVEDVHDLLYCRCAHPMHPEHVEKRRGVMLERYRCPQRRWWNGLHHPYAWAVPREGVPS
ncbi:MAG: hypothetical protein ACJ8GN_11505 [Longimicrobiaceae bacterium]